MAFDKLFRFVFFLYCTSVGTVLVMLPWSPSWSVMVDLLPLESLESLEILKQPWFRGALSGFGLVHFVWGLYDLIALLSPFSAHHDDRHPEIPGHH